MSKEENIGTRKKKNKPVDIINTPDVPFYKYGTPPKCTCMGTGYCWKPCKSKGEKKKIRKRTNRRDVRTWHPEE